MYSKRRKWEKLLVLVLALVMIFQTTNSSFMSYAATDSSSEQQSEQPADTNGNEEADTSDQKSEADETKEEASGGDEDQKQETDVDQDKDQTQDENTDSDTEQIQDEEEAPVVVEEEEADTQDEEDASIEPSDFKTNKFSVIWNDNNETPSENPKSTNLKDRPDADAFADNLVLYYSLDGGDTYVALTKDTMANLGLEKMPKATADTSSERARWTYTYKNDGDDENTLPSKITITKKNDEGESETETKDVIYLLQYSNNNKPTDVSGYIASDYERSESKTEVSIMYTAMQNWTASVDWLDRSVSDEARPSVSSADSIYTVHRYVEGNKDEVEDLGSQYLNVTIDPDDNTRWIVGLKDAPGWNENGKPYVYYVTQDDDVCVDKECGEYTPLFTNVSNYSVEDSALYINGNVANLIENVTEYIAYKEWEDYHDVEGRPTDGLIYLYRITEKKSADAIVTAVEKANPVQGYDNEAVPTGSKASDAALEVNITGNDNDIYRIVIGDDGDEAKLPMYDNRGNKYIYFGLETGIGGEYTKVVNNDLSTESDLVKNAFDSIKAGGQVKYILNGGFITNDREGTISTNPSKFFVANAMQSFENTSVLYSLQIGRSDDSGELVWSNATKDDVVSYEEGKGTTVADTFVTQQIDDFKSEAMGQTASGPVVNKYDSKTGERLQYRWVETAVKINGGDWVNVEDENGNTISSTDANDLAVDDDGNVLYSEINAGEVGPGIAGVMTTALFQPTTNSNDKITNTLVGDRQIKLAKKWTDHGTDITADVDQMEGVSIRFVITRDDGKTTEAEADSDKKLTDSNGNPVDDVILTIEDLNTETGLWERMISSLPRYDEDGREYTYEVSEEEIVDPLGRTWGTECENFITAETNVDAEDEIVPEDNWSYVNSIGDGESLEFIVEKQWLDDGDLLSRKSIEATVYRKGDDGTYSEKVKTVTLNESNNWRCKFYIPKADADDTVDNYLIKETSADSVAVTYDLEDDEIKEQAKESQGSYDYDNRAGRLTEEPDSFFGKILGYILKTDNNVLDYNYDVYIEETDNDGLSEAHYLLTNQRLGAINLVLTKEWNAGTDVFDAEFQLYRDNEKVAVNELVSTKDLEGEVVLNDDGTFTLKKEGVDKDGKSTIKINNLPKYDKDGRMYDYTLVETAMIDGDQKFEFKDRMVKVDGDTYVSSLSKTGEDIVGKAGHHTGDTYTWSGSNTRKETYNIEANKVWRDDGDTKRPDIHFDLYRASTKDSKVAELVEAGDSSALAKYLTSYGDSQLVQKDLLWNTKHNKWYWSADLGSVDRYDADGYRYVYYIIEDYTGEADGYYKMGSNLTANDAGYRPVETPDKKNYTTKEVFGISSDRLDKNCAAIISDGLNVPKDGGDCGDYYSSTIVNTRVADRTINGKKIWNLPEGWNLDDSEMPPVTVDLYRFATPITDADGNKLSEVTQKQLNDKIAEAKAEGEDTSVINTITMNEDGDGNYTFEFTEDKDGNSLQKYDEWGRTWYYYVSEQSDIPGYPETSIKISANNFNMTNIYTDKDDDRVLVTVKKQWLSNVSSKEANAPTEFKLYAIQQDESGRPIGSKKLMETVAMKPLAEGTNRGLNQIDFGEQPYYGTNNRPLLYWVEETPVKGYESVSDETTGAYVGSQDVTKIKNFLSFREDGTTTDGYGRTVKKYTASASYENTYEGKLTSIDFQKVWADDYAGVFDNRDYRIKSLEFEVWRSWPKVSLDGVEQDGGKEKYTDVTLTEDNSWKYHEDNVKQYAENGAAYTYYVKAETEHETYSDESVKMDSYTRTQSGNNAKNTLKTVNAKYTKKWANGDESTMDWATFQRMRDLGALPTTIEFVLQRSTDGTNWDYVDTIKNKGLTDVVDGRTVAGTTYTVAKLTSDNFQKLSTTWTKLPKYKLNTTDEYKYRTIEVLTWADKSVTTFYDNGDSDTLQPKEGKYYEPIEASVETTTSGTTTTSAIKNTIDDRKISLTKKWDDDNGNRDDTRPDSVTLHLTNKADSSKTISFTVAKPAQAGDKNTDGSTSDGYTNTTGSVYVPTPEGITETSTKEDITKALNDTYKVTEDAIPDRTIDGVTYKYTNSEITDFAAGEDTNGIYTVTCTNKGIPEFRRETSVDAQKTFTKDGDWKDVTRSKVQFSLWYKGHNAKNGNNSNDWTRIVNTGTETDEAYYKNFILDNTDPTQIIDINDDKGTGTVQWSKLKKYWERNDQTAGKAQEIIYGVQEELLDADGNVIKTTFTSYENNNGTQPASVTNGKAAITNELQFKPLTIKKDWTGSASSETLSTTYLKTLIEAGLVPEKITFELKYSVDGENYQAFSPAKTQEYSTLDLATKEQNWTGGVPQYDKNGKEISYQIVEKSWTYAGRDDQYTSDTDKSITVDTKETSISGGKYAVTLNNEIKTTEIGLEKDWKDDDDRDGLRPRYITVNLKMHMEGVADKVIQTKTVTSGTDGYWRVDFNDLPTYYNGKAVTYSVEEESVKGYVRDEDGSITDITTSDWDAVKKGYVIINNHTSLRTSLNVTKEWQDNGDEANARPEKIIVVLHNDQGDPDRTAVLVPEEDGSWPIYTFEDLPVYANHGKYVQYSIEEKTVTKYKESLENAEGKEIPKDKDGYYVVISGKQGLEEETSITLTNKYSPENITVDAKKTWADGDLQELVDKGYARPNVTFTLHATTKIDGTESEYDLTKQIDKDKLTVTLTAENLGDDGKWHYEYKDLPAVTDDDIRATLHYYVTEAAIGGYKSDIVGYDEIKNTPIEDELINPVDLDIKKVDKETGDRLPGAVFSVQLKGDKGEAAQTVATDDKGITTFQFTQAGTYTIKEVKAPKGHKLNRSEYEVVVNKSGVVKVQLVKEGDLTFWQKIYNLIFSDPKPATFEDNTLTIEDEPTSVEINKKDIETGDELEGATMVVKDSEGKVVDKWVSGEDGKTEEGAIKPHTIKRLLAGETYTLVETIAPKGYVVSKDTTFQIDEDGKIVKDATTTSVDSNDMLWVEDKPEDTPGPDTAEILVTKALTHVVDEKDYAFSTDLEWKFYVALYDDEALTNRVSNVVTLTYKNSSSATAKFENLEAGKTYYVAECDENGGNPSKEYTGVVTDESGEAEYAYISNFRELDKIKAEAGTNKVFFENQFYDLPPHYEELIVDLGVTKIVKDPDGNIISGNTDPFYVGLYTDEACTTLISTESKGDGSVHADSNIIKVIPGKENKQITHVYFDPENPTTIYMKEVADANGTPLADSTPYKVYFDGEEGNLKKIPLDETIKTDETTGHGVIDVEVINKEKANSKLILEKYIKGALSDKKLTQAQKEKITFRVTGPNGYSEEFSYADFASGKLTIENLMPGKYTVTETNGNLKGYTCTITYDATAGTIFTKKVVLQLANHGTETVKVTDKYAETKGKKTGDASHIGWIIMLLMLALAGIGGTTVYNRRRQ